MMYYFVPKQAERPIYSYKLSIIHFWALIFLYIWAGPHHLHYTALPEWAGTLGMVFSIILWMPSWGGTVSYTHLDVYKRQLLQVWRRHFCQCMN